MQNRKNIIFLIVFISILLLGYFYFYKDSSKNKEYIIIPVNLAAYKLEYNVMDFYDLLDRNLDIEIKNRTIPVYDNIKKNIDDIEGTTDTLLEYLTIEKIQNKKNEELYLATICYPDGGSCTTFYDVLIDRHNRKYYILNGVMSGSIYQNKYLILDNGRKIICYNDMPVSMGAKQISASSYNKDIYPIFLYEIDYNENFAIHCNVSFNNKFNDRINELSKITSNNIYIHNIIEKGGRLVLELFEYNRNYSIVEKHFINIKVDNDKLVDKLNISHFIPPI